jgi:DNA-binding MarR family transcriptional regulator
VSARAASRRPPQFDGGAGDVADELRVWVRLLACANLVSGHLRRNLRREFGMSLPTFDILAQIARPPLGPTMGELSQRLMVSKGSVTDLVERLERAALVARRADARDRRVQRVHLTAKGQRALDQALPAHNAWLRALMAALGPSALRRLAVDLDELKNALRRVEGAARRMRPRGRRGAKDLSLPAAQA